MKQNFEYNGKIFNELPDFLQIINIEDIKNDPELKKLIVEYLEDLPQALSRREKKKLSTAQISERNKTIKTIKNNVISSYNKNEINYPVVYEIMYLKKKQIGASKNDLERSKKRVIESWAKNIAIKICDSRYIYTKKEKDAIKKQKGKK